MKAKDRLDQLKKLFDRLRKESLSAVGTTNEAVYTGLQKFADKELKALHDYYDDALSSLRSQKKSGSGLKTVVETQFDLLQQTVTRLIDHGRESLEQALANAKGGEKSAPTKTKVPARKVKSTMPPKKRISAAVPPKKAAKKAAAKSSTPAKKKSGPKPVKSTVPPKKR